MNFCELSPIPDSQWGLCGKSFLIVISQALQSVGSTSPALTSAAALFTFSRGEHAHCAMPWIRPLTCAQVACSAVPTLLRNSFHPCATGILHHSDRLGLGQGPVVVIGSRCWGSNRSSMCMVLYAWSYLHVWPLSRTAFIPRSQYNTMAVKEGFLGRGMSWWSFTVMLRERYGASGG